MVLQRRNIPDVRLCENMTDVTLATEEREGGRRCVLVASNTPGRAARCSAGRVLHLPRPASPRYSVVIERFATLLRVAVCCSGLPLRVRTAYLEFLPLYSCWRVYYAPAV